MSSGRAVYIPPAKRRQHQQQQQQHPSNTTSNSSSRSNHSSKRFHGAFTGGFSAGYFNTVATKEGWAPSTQKRKDQQIADFMDEQDHEEWGGPTALRTEYQQDDPTAASESSKSKKVPDTFAPLTPFFQVSHISVGPRLLRRLGYREADGSAYVQQEDSQHPVTSVPRGEIEDGDQDVSHILSKKRLRKIQLQSSTIVLPSPKLDTCGLGFVALLDAPEFQQYKERRKQQAKLRARGATDVYRLDHLVSNQGQAAGASIVQDHLDHEAYEAPEDFVGTRSAAGFALRDEDDDAYDTSLAGRLFSGRGAVKPSKEMLGDEYQDFIDDPADDSSDDGDQRRHHQQQPKTSLRDKEMSKPSSKSSAKKDLFAGALAQWATGVAASGATKTTSSAAKAPVPGFSWGGSMESHKKRYPGPDIPRDYEVTKHMFASPPSIPERLRVAPASRKDYGYGQHPPTSEVQRDTRRLGGDTFVSLAAAMKNRFTSASTPDNTNLDGSGAHVDGGGPKQSVGLRWPSQIQPAKAQGDQVANHTVDSNKVIPPAKVSVSRTTKTFTPHPLLCKRFGVPPPDQTAANESNTTPLPGKEAQFFKNEVLPNLRKQPPSMKNTPKEVISNESGQKEPMVDSNKREENDVARPPLEELRTIFQPVSDSSEDDTDLDSVNDEKVGQESIRQELTQTMPVEVADVATQDIDVPFETLAGIDHADVTNQAMIVYEEPNNTMENADKDDQSEGSSEESSRRARKRRRKHRHKSRKEHKRSRSKHRYKDDNDDDADSDTDESRRRRRKERSRKERKKRRKHRSSHRHDNSSGDESASV